MLCLRLPNGETRGECKINGRPCDFEVDGLSLRFRYKGTDRDEPWNDREIRSRVIEDEATTYICS